MEQEQKESSEIVHQKDIGEEAEDNQRKARAEKNFWLRSRTAELHWNLSLIKACSEAPNETIHSPTIVSSEA